MPARFFQPAQSQQHVPSYAPLPLDAVQYGVERAVETRERADQALDQYTAQQQAILSQLTPQNRTQAQEILQQDEQFIERLIDPDEGVRYQDMVPLLRRQARQTQGEIQPYLEDSAQMRAFQERATAMYDKGDLDLDLRNYYDRLMGDYEGLQFDEQGRPQGFRPPALVRSVDIDKRMRDFMQHVEVGNESVLIDEYGADPRFVKEIRQKGVSETDYINLQRLFKQHLLSDPEVQQYLGAKHEAEQDLRQRTDSDPVEFNEFVDNILNPYVAAEALPQRTERLRSNPGFSAEDLYSNVLSPSIMIGSTESEIVTPGQYQRQVGELTAMYEGAQEKAFNELSNMGLNPRYDSQEGRLIVDNPIVDGVDQSPHIAAANAELAQARQNLLNMQEYDNRVRRQAEKATGLSFANEDEDKFAGELEDAFNSWNQPRGTLQIGRGEWARLQDKDPWEEFQQSDQYTRTMQRFSPLYRKYVELFHENAKGGHREVPTALVGESFFQNYLKKSVPPLFDGKTRDVLYDSELNDMKDEGINIRDAEYSGMFIDPETGEFMVAYQAFDSEGSNPRLLLTKAPRGSEQFALQAGMIDQIDHYVLSQVRQLTDQPGRSGENVTIPMQAAEYDFGQAAMEVRMLPRADQDAQRGRMYEVIVTSPEGRRSSQFVGSGDAITQGYKNYLQNLLESKRDGK